MIRFGTDGIRGRYPQVVNEVIARNLEEILGEVILTGDTRFSTYNIAKALKGIWLGILPTAAAAYFSTKFNKKSIVISASHNPYFDNGLKIFFEDGFKPDEEKEKSIEKELNERFNNNIELNDREIVSFDEGITREYALFLKDIIKYFNIDLKEIKSNTSSLVIDTANGAATLLAKVIFQEILGLKNIHFIADSPNGFNINEKCGVMHLDNIKNVMQRSGAKVGIAFDGDADRCITLLKIGKNILKIDGDMVLVGLAEFFKLKNVGISVMANMEIRRILEKLQIDYKILPVGDKYIANAIKSNQIQAGSEQSGHIVVSPHKSGDGILTAVFTLYLLIKGYDFTKFNYWPQKLENVKVKDKLAILNDDKYLEFIKDIESKYRNEARILVRPSGTEDLIRVMVEAKDEKNLELCDYIADFIRKNYR